ncbi:MAG: hypothetical protein HXY20_03695 [Acidobacteria bacterium]|nr:hypothetical protein [Acidobacteriota bacterium]
MTLVAGAAIREISPNQPMQLCGYPHVLRLSTGIHDPLLAAALYLENGSEAVLLGVLDLLMINSDAARRLRKRVSSALRLPEERILISCTHTHSAPVTARYLPFIGDPAMPMPDADYLQFCEDRFVESAVAARVDARPAGLCWTTADGTGVGGNRNSPEGPADPEVGVLAIQADGKLHSLAVIYGMHPTVLHEDSTLVSADFPHFVRRDLQDRHGARVLYFTGPCGNQSPRRHVAAQTFSEAERLGRLLGSAVEASLDDLQFDGNPVLSGRITSVDLPWRKLPTVAEAQDLVARRREEYERLKAAAAPRADVRTAEVAVFGAEATLRLAQCDVEAVLASVLPAEVQVLRIGDSCVVGFPGEIFVEYALDLKTRAPIRTFVIAFANGELQGYIVTAEALAAGGYEAASSLFVPAAGRMLVDAALGAMEP